MIAAFLRRLFRRKPEQQPIAIDLYERTTGVEWRVVGRYKTHNEAIEASEQHAANACFKSGNVVFFEFKFTPVFAELPKPEGARW